MEVWWRVFTWDQGGDWVINTCGPTWSTGRSISSTRPLTMVMMWSSLFSRTMSMAWNAMSDISTPMTFLAPDLAANMLEVWKTQLSITLTLSMLRVLHPGNGGVKESLVYHVDASFIFTCTSSVGGGQTSSGKRVILFNLIIPPYKEGCRFNP